MSYRRRCTPLHAAGAAAGCLYCLALGLGALLAAHPLLLAAVVVAELAAGAAAGLGPVLRRVLLLVLPLALAIILVNALLTRDGLTVIVRLGQLPLLGHTDVTLEATAYGAVLGLRAVALILCGALYTAGVDPDGVLVLFRRISFRSALTATLATRMVPVLLRDSRGLAEAQRCRPGGSAGRLALLRATTAGTLDRALEVAAALEVRGYGAARRPARRRRRLGRHDWGFAASGLALIALTVSVAAAGWAPFSAYPELRASGGPGVVLPAAALVLVALLPFADRRGIR